MCRMFTMLFIILAAISPADAQDTTSTWKGYLVDQMCGEHMKGERADYYAKRHTRVCNFHDDCSASGFGIMVKGTYIRLTPTSSPKAIAYLNTIDKRNSVYVAVSGSMTGDKIAVKMIETAEEPELDE